MYALASTDKTPNIELQVQNCSRITSDHAHLSTASAVIVSLSDVNRYRVPLIVFSIFNVFEGRAIMCINFPYIIF